MANEHEMYKVRTHESGDEEWQCSECERRLVFEVETLQRVVVNEGNALAQHVGYGMDLEMTADIVLVDDDDLGEPDGTGPILH